MLTPAPGPTPSDEQELDAILGNIDRLVEHQVKKATEHHSTENDTPAPPPTQCFSAARYKKTQQAFQSLSESKLFLDESRSDMAALPEEEGEAPASAPAPAPRKSIWPWKRAALG